MTRVATWVLIAAVTAGVGCGDDTTTGTGGGGTGASGTGGGDTGGGTGGDATTTTGSDTTTSSSGSPTTTTGAGGEGGEGGGGPAACGNGVVEDGEACDDGDESATCDVDCTPAACGDAVLNLTAGEGCDEGGETAECDVDCTPASCGDSTLNESAGETCDDGGRSASCNADCTSASCGDGVVNAAAGEVCDDAGESATCDVDCSAVDCGDGVTNEAAGEICDGMGETAACDADCTPAACGDGLVNPTAGEECEDGNDVTTDGCVACQTAECGDGFVQAGVEQCDDGNADPGDGCSATCQSERDPQCSQPYAVLDGADRNVAFNDQGTTVWCDENGVSPGWVGLGWYRFSGAAGTMMPTAPPPPYSCATHAAGWMDGEHPAVQDGIVSRPTCFSWTPGTCWQTGNIEVVNCGDFYLYNLTAPPSCSYRYCGTNCGDGVVDPGEVCDDGNRVDGDGCPRGCGEPVCGNGVVDAGEECDDGGVVAGDGCSPTCQADLHPQCGQPVQLLNRADRNASFNDGDSGNEFCDSTSFTSPDWLGASWYRFTGAAGTRMPEAVPSTFSCQTDAPGWLNGAHPGVADGVVDRQVCFNWSGNACNWTANVQVVNCRDHYRYNLPVTPACHLRYCGSN